MTMIVVANLGDGVFNIETSVINGSAALGAGASFVNNTSGAPVALSLPIGYTLVYVKDTSYTAGEFPITITPTAGLIEGQSTFVIGTAGGWVQLSWDGNNYWQIG
jgi:hypothetical protein